MRLIQNAIAEAIASGLAEIYTAMPAIVVSFDADDQTVNVQPAIKRGVIGEDGSRIVERLPQIPRVPVLYPSGGRFEIRFPLEEGDVVLLHFSHVSLDRWLARGGEVDPEDDTRGGFTDCFATPSVRSYRDAIPIASDRLRLGHADGDAIEIQQDRIEANGEPIAYLKALKELKQIFNQWVVAPMDGGAALKTLLNGWTPSGTE